MTTILAVDPGTLCGWAVLRPRGAIDSGTWDLRPRRFEGAGMRWLRLRKHLAEAIALAAPGVVAVEEVRRHLGTDAAHVYGGIVAIVQEECEAREIPYLGIPVATVKRIATGKGNANKAAILAATRERWAGWSGDDNEADARWIAVAALAEVGAQA